MSESTQETLPSGDPQEYSIHPNDLHDIDLVIDDEHNVSVPFHDLSAHLAGEIASRLSPLEAILERYGVSDSQWAVIKDDPIFRGMVREKVQEFDSDLNTLNRVKLKAGMALEDSVEEVYKMVHDPALPGNARMEGVKVLRQLAGADHQEQVGGGEKFSISINVGSASTNQPITIEGTSNA